MDANGSPDWLVGKSKSKELKVRISNYCEEVDKASAGGNGSFFVVPLVFFRPEWIKHVSKQAQHD